MYRKLFFYWLMLGTFSGCGSILDLTAFKRLCVDTKLCLPDEIPGVTQKELESMRRDLIVLMGEFDLFEDREMESIILDWQLKEWRIFGNPDRAEAHKTTPYKDTVIMQRSAHYRLYDHNIILAGIFEDKLLHKSYGKLAKKFEGALFFDIGSAILIEDGAPTVRDIYNDKRIANHFSNIIASDINESDAPFVKTYKRLKQNLPFPVQAVPLKIINAEQVFQLTNEYLKQDMAVILRSSNAGPDFYYNPADVKTHLRAVVRAFYDRDVLYFFNKFVLFKAAHRTKFQCLGRDSAIGNSHNQNPWEDVNWKERKLYQSFIPEASTIEIVRD